MMESRSLLDLWRAYLFLTREISKFADRRDMEMVGELIGQREKLQTAIEAHPDSDFRNTPEGQALMQELTAADAAAKRSLQRTRNVARNRRAVAEAYTKF